MATLHMDIEAARKVSTKMGSSVDSIQQILVELDSVMANLLGGAWIGNSASDFQSQFSEWSNQTKQAAETLETLKNKLEFEVSQWENVSAKLG